MGYRQVQRKNTRNKKLLVKEQQQWLKNIVLLHPTPQKQSSAASQLRNKDTGSQLHPDAPTPQPRRARLGINNNPCSFKGTFGTKRSISNGIAHPHPIQPRKLDALNPRRTWDRYRQPAHLLPRLNLK